MSRYIDAEKIKYERHEKIGLGIDYSIDEPEYYEVAYKKQIDQIPTADVQEVVRCKDCIAYDSKTDRFEMNVCKRNNKIFPKNGYCSFGIKKDCDTKMNGINNNDNHEWLQYLDKLELELFKIWKRLEEKYGPYDADVDTIDDCVEKIRNIRPVIADIQEIKHGEWIYDKENECWYCSLCEYSALNNYRGLSVESNYCPNCGAKMDSE